MTKNWFLGLQVKHMKIRVLLVSVLAGLLGPACLPDESSEGPLVPVTIKIDTPDQDSKIIPGGSLDFSCTTEGGEGDITILWDFDGAAPQSTLEDPGTVALDAPLYEDLTVTCRATDAYGSTAISSETVKVQFTVVTIDLPREVTICQGEAINLQATFTSVAPPNSPASWLIDNDDLRYWDYPNNLHLDRLEDPGWVTFPDVGTFDITYTNSGLRPVSGNITMRLKKIRKNICFHF